MQALVAVTLRVALVKVEKSTVTDVPFTGPTIDAPDPEMLQV